MKATVAIAICIALLGIIGCGGGSTSTSHPTVAPAAPIGANPPTSRLRSTSPDGQLVVMGGRLGDLATATLKTTPSTSCSIVYILPSGQVSTDDRLTQKAARADGIVSWTWLISPQTVPTGTGTVTVTCGNDNESATITIG
jgi:hypothetical protein